MIVVVAVCGLIYTYTEGAREKHFQLLTGRFPRHSTRYQRQLTQSNHSFVSGNSDSTVLCTIRTPRTSLASFAVTPPPPPPPPPPQHPVTVTVVGKGGWGEGGRGSEGELYCGLCPGSWTMRWRMKGLHCSLYCGLCL